MADGMGTQQKKRIVAELLIRKAGDLVEFWSDCGDADVPVDEVRDFLTTWLKNLPGDAWDTRLDRPGA